MRRRRREREREIDRRGFCCCDSNFKILKNSSFFPFSFFVTAEGAVGCVRDAIRQKTKRKEKCARRELPEVGGKERQARKEASKEEKALLFLTRALAAIVFHTLRPPTILLSLR